MQIFKDLAILVEKEWARSGYNLEAFVAVATRATTQFAYDWPLEKLEIKLNKWLLEQPSLPHQMSVHNTFGQPSVTVFNNNRFVLDLYFWTDFDTSIHSHGFRGAFRVLHGESLQETFKAPLADRIADDLQLVDLTEIGFAHLKQNDTCEIAPGGELIHRVVHLANPTVTLCVKTINEPRIKQWNYLPTGVAIQRQSLSDDLLKKVYFYQYLISRNPPHAERFFDEILTKLNISTQLHLFEAVAGGTLDLNERAATQLAMTIENNHAGSRWWSAYTQAHLDQADEIQFEPFQKPIERLVAHFTNCKYDLGIIEKFTAVPVTDLSRLSRSMLTGN